MIGTIGSDIGATNPGSLPKITGLVYQPNSAAGGFASMGFSGAFTQHTFTSNIGKYSAPSGDTPIGLAFDASLSSPAYNRTDDLIIPYCILVRHIIKY